MAEMKIGDRTFKVEPMLATQAIRLQMRLLKALGVGIDRLPDIFKGMQPGASPEVKNEGNSAAIAAFSDIFVKGDPDEITNLVKTIVESAMIQQKSGSYTNVEMDREFTGDLEDLLTVAVFVLREQFGSFFTGALVNGSLSKLVKG